MSLLSQILLTLFVLNLGIVFGAGIYETRIVVPMWFTKSLGTGYQINSQAMRDMNVGRKFWGFVSTMPLTLLTLASVFVTWQADQPGYDWWFAATWITLAERICTFAFFIPNAIKLGKADGQSAELSRLAMFWIHVNYIRVIISLAGWLLALKAFAICL